MREIKFRAWSGTHMREWQDLKYTFMQSLKYEPVMQYTGLKDKNGVEIYEGDIVRNAVDKDHDVEEVPVLSFYQYGTARHFMIWPEEYEVIGNIYENPELLEKQA